MADIFTDAGAAAIADILDGTIGAITTWYVAWGTGAGTAAKANTTLFTEAAESRVSVTKSQPSAPVNRFVGTITSLSNQTITNAGIFSATSAGTMLEKSDFTGIALLTGDSIQFTFDLTHS